MSSDNRPHGKVVPLKEAIQQLVHPGISLHLAGGIGGPSAAICEIIRQFIGKQPGFEIIQSTITGHAINLIHCQLARKVVFSACIDISKTSHPSKVMQKAFSEKKITLENWSLLSLQQKLMAGAMGISFMPTRSITGSSIAEENPDGFKLIADPFGGKEKTGVLKAVVPDLSIVHGVAADSIGNTIMAAPFGDDLWGELASKNGVIVTVEKILPDSEMRRYSSLVKIPSHIVQAVCHAPMGLHPFSCTNPALADLESYEADQVFLEDLHHAFAEPELLDSWISEWVTGCPTHADYLKKVGEERLNNLKTKASISPSLETTPDQKTDESTGSPAREFTPNEMLLVAGSRIIRKQIVESGHRVMLVGAGTRSMAAQLAYQQLRLQNYEIELITGNGQVGHVPQPEETGSQSVRVIRSAKMLTDTITSQGVFVNGRNSKCLSVLGAGQIDKYANINSSRTSDGDFLVGTGGANDAANADEVIIILNQSARRFVDQLNYITAMGYNVVKVISTLGVFSKPKGRHELELVACLKNNGEDSRATVIKEISGKCGWSIKQAANIELIEPPTAQELENLRALMSA